MLDEVKILKLKVDGQLVSIMQRKDMFSVSLDTILLVDFVRIKNLTKTLIDFGTNNGAIAIFLAKRYPIKIIGVEIQEEAVQLAVQNVRINNLQEQITICWDDIRSFAQNSDLKVDVIVCNPPFFPVSNKTNFKLDPLKIAARHEVFINLDLIIASAAKLLKVKGKFFIIYNIERLDELFVSFKKNNFSVKRMQVVYPKVNKPANLVLIEAVFRTNSTMIVEQPLICHNENNSYNTEITKWYNQNNSEN